VVDFINGQPFYFVQGEDTETNALYYLAARKKNAGD